VLAAGAGTRFGGPKQRLLLPLVLARLARAAVEEIVVVAGAYPLAAGGARVVDCPDWERGPGASLRCGLGALSSGTEAAVVVLADGPNLAPEAVERVLAAWRAGAGELVAASYGGDRGHPLVVGRELWGHVPDEGFRTLAPALVPCDDLGPPGDVDTADEIGRVEPPPAED
jgi:nicotine blue oxidoreductase